MEPTVAAHLARIKRKLADGRAILDHLHQDGPQAYDIPHSHANNTIRERDPPRNNDTFVLNLAQ